MIPIERMHEFRGRYHVLGGALSPIDGVDADDLRIAELYRRVAARRLAGPRGRARDQPDDDRRGDGAAHRRRAARARAGGRRDAARERPAGRLRPRVRRRGHARARVRRPPRAAARDAPRGAGAAYAPAADEHRRDEVRRHLGRRRRADQARRAADRRQARGGQPRRRRAVGARQDDRRADRDGRGGLAGAATRARWTCCSRPASGSRARCARWRSTTSASRRCR